MRHAVSEGGISLNKKMLIVDDEVNICSLISLYAKKEGYEVMDANDGAEAIEKFGEFKPDIIILDIMLPKKDGWQVCREIRAVSKTPIIMLTAKGETFDKVLGLEMGADDYMVKPFEMKELMARAKAVLRRAEEIRTPEKEDELVLGELSINQTTHEAKIRGKILSLPLKEFELLTFLAKNRNKVFKREELLEKIWGYEFVRDSRTVDVHIKRLREKIESPENPWRIQTVWRVGYKFDMK